MKKLVIEGSKDGKEWEELFFFSVILPSPSEAISVKGWKYIRVRVAE